MRNRAADTAAEMHEWAAVKSPLGAQTVLGDRHDLVCEFFLQAPSAACGTRPRELSNGWTRKRMRNRSEKRSSENLIRQRGQRNDLNPGVFASRAGVCVGVLARAGGRAGFQRAARLSPVSNQSATKNLHEPLLSPCMFERQDMRPAALA